MFACLICLIWFERTRLSLSVYSVLCSCWSLKFCFALFYCCHLFCFIFFPLAIKTRSSKATKRSIYLNKYCNSKCYSNAILTLSTIISRTVYSRDDTISAKFYILRVERHSRLASIFLYNQDVTTLHFETASKILCLLLSSPHVMRTNT